MNNPNVSDGRGADGDDGVSMIAAASVLVRRRRMIAMSALVGMSVGLASALLGTRLFVSTVTFIPQEAESVPAGTGLALAASQFGIRVPTGRSEWGPAIYAELLQSRSLLEPIAIDSVVVAEEAGRRRAYSDLLRIRSQTMAERSERTVEGLRKIIDAVEVRPIGAVRLIVATPWPSVSLALAERLVDAVNLFNLKTRKSQASAERQFVELQVARTERSLREAEDLLQRFLQRNRNFASSPELVFERDRLQGEVTLRQHVYTSLVQNREDATIREVRNTPVITVIESPRLPVAAAPRQAALKGVLGLLLGGMTAMLLALGLRYLTALKEAKTEEAQAFFEAISEAMPRFLRSRSLGG